MRAAAVTCATATALLAGCGSSEEAPPAPEPVVSPPLSERPAGRLVDVGGDPEGVVADPRTGLVAVALRNPDRLVLLDGASGRRVRQVPLPESPRHLQLAPRSRVLAPAERGDVLVEAPLAGGGEPTVTPVGEFPHDAAAASGRILVGNENADTVTIIDRDGATHTLEAPQGPGGVAAVPGSSLVAVVGVRERLIALYDVAARRQVGEAAGGVGPTHAVATDGHVYVADTEGDAILKYRLGPEFGFLDRANVPGAPYGLALDRRRDRLWVTLTESNELVLLELTATAPEEVARFPTVRQPNSVAVDERSGRVYVAGRGGSELQIVGR